MAKRSQTVNIKLSGPTDKEFKQLVEKQIRDGFKDFTLTFPEQTRRDILNSLKDEYVRLGGHRVEEVEEGDGLAFSCDDCEWCAAAPTDGLSDKQRRLTREYVFADALDTNCPVKTPDNDDDLGFDTSDVDTNTEEIAGIPVYTPRSM